MYLLVFTKDVFVLLHRARSSGYFTDAACWAPSRTASNIPESAGINPVNPPAVSSASTPFRTLYSAVAMRNLPGTLGEPDASNARLTDEKFPGWSLLRRCRLTFEGVGGSILAERGKLHRCEIAIIGNAAYRQAIQSTLMSQLEGKFKIHSNIAIPGLSATSSIAALYVGRMNRFSNGVAYYLENPPFLLAVDLPRISRSSGPEVLKSSVRAQSWYRNSMTMGRVAFHAD